MFRTVFPAARAILRVLATVLALVALAQGADARPRHKIYPASDECNRPGPNAMPCEGVTSSARGEMIAKDIGFGAARKFYRPRASANRPPVGSQLARAAVVAHPSGCPSRAFCGCGAAVRVFGAPVRSLWLAANWYRFPRAAPAPGMVAVRRHHVFVLEANLGSGLWQVYDANSGGHATRIHARSIAGYVIVNPRGGAA